MWGARGCVSRQGSPLGSGSHVTGQIPPGRGRQRSVTSPGVGISSREESPTDSRPGHRLSEGQKVRKSLEGGGEQ